MGLSLKWILKKISLLQNLVCPTLLRSVDITSYVLPCIRLVRWDNDIIFYTNKVSLKYFYLLWLFYRNLFQNVVHFIINYQHFYFLWYINTFFNSFLNIRKIETTYSHTFFLWFFRKIYKHLPHFISKHQKNRNTILSYFALIITHTP